MSNVCVLKAHRNCKFVGNLLGGDGSLDGIGVFCLEVCALDLPEAIRDEDLCATGAGFCEELGFCDI